MRYEIQAKVNYLPMAVQLFLVTVERVMPIFVKTDQPYLDEEFGAFYSEFCVFY